MSRKFLKSVALTLCLSVAVPLFNTINAFATTQPSIMGESAITMDLDTGELFTQKMLMKNVHQLVQLNF